MAKVTVIGSGAWGIALALLFHNNGHKVCIWSAFEEEISALRRDGEHKSLLPGVKIPNDIELTTDISCAKSSDVIMLAVPSFAIINVCNMLKPYINHEQMIINAGKGLEPESGKRFSQVIEETIGITGVVIISGPSHAEEVARKIPTSVVVSSTLPENACKAQDYLMSSYMRIYVNDDIVGVELGGALKNIIAVCAGICDGMGLGDNTKAALMTRGLSEISRLGIAMGGSSETFMGLAGMGDLIVTCCSKHSRNHRAGELIGKGMSAEEAIKTVGTVEGYYALRTAYEVASKLGVEMPIVNACYEVFMKGLSPKSAIEKLMQRPKKSEGIL